MLRLDKFTHNHPIFYHAKHALFGYLKEIVYQITGNRDKVKKIKERIFKQQKAIYSEYLSNRKILDIGCGRGDFLSKICREYNSTGIGIDISWGMLNFAKSNNPGVYIMSDSGNIPFKDKSFDAVVLKGVLHHLPTEIRLKTLKEAERLSKESILIEEPCCFENRILKLISRLYWKIEDHGYYYGSEKDWAEIIGEGIIETILGEGFVRYVMFIKKCK
ncbi:TPA: class I SAM-dependent methyltransferase [Candidatus Poribacteria bacterium]|nr:class I SAM-dependent methyltransferase [Candidatus Poribacteria bacterium]